MHDNTQFHHALSGKKCTSGFLNTLDVDPDDSRSLVPLLEQYGSVGAEQWIFPSLRFTCPGRLTKWIYRAPYARATSPECRVNIGTWRLDRSSFGTVYRRMSTTEGLQRSTSDGLVYTYEFPSPVHFQPGDILGVDLSSYTCSVFGGTDNILSLNISGIGSTVQSYRQIGTGSIFRVAQNPITYLIPFVQPVIGKLLMLNRLLNVHLHNKKNRLVRVTNCSFVFITDTATIAQPTTGNTVSTATNTEGENYTMTTTVREHLTSSEANDEMRTMTSNEPLSTTTDGSSGLVNTAEPDDKLVLIIHIVSGVGIGALALLGIVVTCVGLVGIMKCLQARMAKQRRSNDIEEPEVVTSRSNGTLLQENAAYKRLMKSLSTDTTVSGYETMLIEGSTRTNSEEPQVVGSNSNGTLLYDNSVYKSNNWSTDITGYETISIYGRTSEQLQFENMVSMSTEEESNPDRAQPHDSKDLNGIIVQENSAYSSREIVALYESTSTEESRESDSYQCANSSGIAVHKSTACKKPTKGGDTVAEYETMDEIDEQGMQLNQAYGFKEESQGGTESANAGEYESVTGDSTYDYSSQTLGVDIKSTLAEPVTHDRLSQEQQHTSSEDNEHPYDYVI